MLGVVGYPADKTLTDKDGREEKGALMYEMFKDIQYSLEDKRSNPLQMLEYRISTHGGKHLIIYSASQVSLNILQVNLVHLSLARMGIKL